MEKNIKDDVIVLVYQDGSEEPVTVPAGTVDKLTGYAEAAGIPLEDFIIKVITDFVTKLTLESEQENSSATEETVN